jgi:light-regulated signal transduction histidine kinase (bacteriophytochrome)
LRKNGERLDVSLTISPINNTEGALIGAATIARDVTERKRLADAQQRLSAELECGVRERTLELARANEALERSNLELQQFAYVASHDLQTPLRAIAGFAQFLKADYEDRLDAKGNEYIERIIRGATRLQELIEDLLDLSRIESQAAPFTPVDLADAVGEAVDTLHESIQNASAEVTHSGLPVVHGDRKQLVHLLMNLIENGVKYRRTAPPRIHVTAEQADGGWTIAVTDNGIGVAPQHHEKIFEIFRRLHSHQAYPGTGIGLSLCRRIVNRHGGRIWVSSEEGKGSSFLFTLPDAPSRNETVERNRQAAIASRGRN